MRYTLRPYQVDSIERTRAEIRQGHKRVVIVAPCGAGKTSIACSIIESAVAKGNRAIFVAHRKELVGQASARLDSIGIDHGIIMANHERRKPDCPVQVASIQTLIRRDHPEAQLVVFDEAHLSISKSWQAVAESYKDAVILGLTATPYRGDSKGLHHIFNGMVVVAQPRELVPEFLMEPRIFAADKPDLRKVHTVRGDYDETELAGVMMAAHLIGNVVTQWVKTANGVRTLVFAVNVAHSKALRDRFREAGVAAEHIDATTPATERSDVLARLRSGETRVVCNVGILTTGYDLPELGCVSLARPTQSLVLALQMIGRVLRPFPGKAAPLILDHGDVVRKHGHPLDERAFTLDDLPKIERGSGERKASTVKICDACQAVAPATAKACPECGEEFTAKTPMPEEHDAELREQEIHKRPPRVAKADKVSEWQRLEAIRKQKGYSRFWTSHRYRAKFGVWPRGVRSG
jgi:superfamily II DNA or RNA helicase